MTSVRVRHSNYDGHHAARAWLHSRGVRVLGFGGKHQGFNEVQSIPYVIQAVLDGPPEEVGYDYKFTDDLSELAMLFKLTFG